MDVAAISAGKTYLGSSVDVRPGFEIDDGVLSDLLVERLGSDARVRSVRQFAGGQSNPTYLVVAGDRRLVLRRRPPGDLLASAHAVDREFRLLTALYGTGVPVPEPILLCEDPAVLGSAFYVMAHVEGRIFYDNAMPDLDPRERGAVFDAANEVLAKLHALDPAAIGLDDFGRPGNYFSRQIARWSRQYAASRSSDIPEMDRVGAWLADNVPPEVPKRIVHGDFGFHNLMIAPRGADVVAVLDWELSTLGDPVADLTYLGMEWYRPPGIDARGTLADKDLAALGVPDFETFAARYCERVGRPPIAGLGFYKAFNLFRGAAILQGVAARHHQGNAADATAAAQEALVAPLARAAWSHAVAAGAER